MTDNFIAFCHSCGKVIPGVVELMFRNKFFPKRLEKRGIRAQLSQRLHVHNKMHVSSLLWCPDLSFMKMPGYLAIVSYHFTRGILQILTLLTRRFVLTRILHSKYEASDFIAVFEFLFFLKIMLQS